MRFPTRDPVLWAGQQHPSRPAHVLTPTEHPSDSGTAACGSPDRPVMSCRADLVPLSRRCAADGCYERWPYTDAAHQYLSTAISEWGRRTAGVTE